MIEGNRPGVAERIGIGPDTCLQRNPALVYGRMTGWGQDGPLAQTAGHDINYIAVAGALAPLGRAGGPPQFPLNLIGDFGGGAMYLLTGILAALFEARGSGRGQVVDAAIVDGVAHLTTMIVALQRAGAWSGQRGTNLLDGGAPFYDVYETSDGLHVSVGALEPRFYAELIERLELDDLPDRYDFAGFGRLRECSRLRSRRRPRQTGCGSSTGATPACRRWWHSRTRPPIRTSPPARRRARRGHPAGAGATLLAYAGVTRPSAVGDRSGHALGAARLGRRRRRRADR